MARIGPREARGIGLAGLILLALAVIGGVGPGSQLDLDSWLRLGEAQAFGWRPWALAAGAGLLVVALVAGPQARQVPRSGRISTRWWLAGLLVVWLFTRLLVISRFPPFWDEAFFAAQSHTGLLDPGHRWDALLDNKGPLFNWIAMVLQYVGATPLISVRLVAFLSGLATLLATFFLGRRLSGDRAGCFAAGFYVLLPPFVVHDVVGLYDPLITASAAWALVLLLALADRPRVRIAFALGAVVGVGILTKSTGYVALVLLPTGFIVAAHGTVRERLRSLGPSLAIAVVVALGIGAISALGPALTAGERQMRDDAGALQVHSASDVLSHAPQYLHTAGVQYFSLISRYVTVGALVLLAVGLWCGWRERRRLVVAVVPWMVAPLIAVLLFTVLTRARYILPALAPAPAYMGVGAEAILIAARRRYADWRAGVLVSALAIVLLAPAAVFAVRFFSDPETVAYPEFNDDAQYRTYLFAGTGFRAVADQLSREAGAGDVVRYSGPPPWQLLALLRNPRIPGPARLAPDAGATLVGDADDGPVRIVAGSNRLAREARFYVWNEATPPSRADIRGFRLSVRGDRAVGPPVLLFVRDESSASRPAGEK